MQNTTIAAIATAPGAGGIAVVRLSGPESYAVAGALDAVEGGFGLDAVSVCVDDALDALCELTGENASEAVINEVFERFCVGK